MDKIILSHGVLQNIEFRCARVKITHENFGNFDTSVTLMQTTRYVDQEAERLSEVFEGSTISVYIEEFLKAVYRGGERIHLYKYEDSFPDASEDMIQLYSIRDYRSRLEV